VKNDPNFIIGHCDYLELPLGRYKLVLGAAKLDLVVVLASEGYHYVVTFDGFIKGFNTCLLPALYKFGLEDPKRCEDAINGILLQFFLRKIAKVR
jgi:hypothetical protein